LIIQRDTPAGFKGEPNAPAIQIDVQAPSLLQNSSSKIEYLDTNSIPLLHGFEIGPKRSCFHIADPYNH
jgi:hypothetical protein